MQSDNIYLQDQLFKIKQKGRGENGCLIFSKMK